MSVGGNNDKTTELVGYYLLTHCHGSRGRAILPIVGQIVGYIFLIFY